MRKARAFSTPGDMPSCGGGVWVLLNQDDIGAGAAVYVLQVSGAGGSLELAWLSVLYCFRALVALASRAVRSVPLLLILLAAALPQAVCSARSAHRSGALAGLQLVQAID